MHFKLKILIIIYCLFSLTSKSQNFEDDAMKIGLAYKNAAKLSVDFEYRMKNMYPNDTSTQVQKGKMFKEGQNKYMKLDNIETIINSEYMLTVDHDKKQINLRNVTPNLTTPANEELVVEKLKEMVSFTSKVDFIAGESTSTYVLHFANQQYRKVVFEYINEKYLIKRVLFEFSTDDEYANEPIPQMEIYYLKQDTNPKIKKSHFTCKKYLNREGDNFIKNKEYAAYDLVNLWSPKLK